MGVRPTVRTASSSGSNRTKSSVTAPDRWSTRPPSTAPGVIEAPNTAEAPAGVVGNMAGLSGTNGKRSGAVTLSVWLRSFHCAVSVASEGATGEQARR